MQDNDKVAAGLGAGKSTLLDLLAGRKTVGELKGDILFSGIQPSKAFLRRYTGAPPQHTSHLACAVASACLAAHCRSVSWCCFMVQLQNVWAHK